MWWVVKPAAGLFCLATSPIGYWQAASTPNFLLLFSIFQLSSFIANDVKLSFSLCHFYFPLLSAFCSHCCWDETFEIVSPVRWEMTSFCIMLEKPEFFLQDLELEILLSLFTLKPSLILYLAIPLICHFFTWAKFLDDKIYTEKRQFFALNLYKTPLFRVKSVQNANFSR